jgi:hypothetical protein
MKSPLDTTNQNLSHAVEYSQAFGDLAGLLCEYQAALCKVKPLQEEDVLFLLLS